MAKNRKNHPLFDYMRRPGSESNRPPRTPDWMRPHVDRPSPASRPAPVEDEPVQLHAAVDPSDHHAPVQARERRHIEIRLTRGMALGLILGGVGLLILVGFGVYLYQERQTDNRIAQYKQSLGPFADLRLQEPRPGLIPSHVAGVGSAEGQSTRQASLAIASEDPRVPGLNYFRLVQFPASARAETDRVSQYLAQNGVDAAWVPTKDGKDLILYALRGFVKISSDEALAYREKLRSLGRQWKAQHRGTTTWSDLYPEKYRGVTD